MSGDECDGMCECACGWQQDHPYSQRCIPTCMLPKPVTLEDDADVLP